MAAYAVCKASPCESYIECKQGGDDDGIGLGCSPDSLLTLVGGEVADDEEVVDARHERELDGGHTGEERHNEAEPVLEGKHSTQLRIHHHSLRVGQQVLLPDLQARQRHELRSRRPVVVHQRLPQNKELEGEIGAHELSQEGLPGVETP